MPKSTDPANLIPLTSACAALAQRGVSIGYNSLWTLTASGRIPTKRRGNRIYLIGSLPDLAKAVARELEAPAIRVKPRARVKPANPPSPRARVKPANPRQARKSA